MSSAEIQKPKIVNQPNPAKRIIRRLGLVLLVLSILFFLMAWFWNYSTGYRVGKVIKVSHKGFVIKTWEGELDLGYLSTNQGALATRIFNFSVDRGEDQVRRQIDSAYVRDQKVKLYYREKVFLIPWRGDTRYFVYKVERIGG